MVTAWKLALCLALVAVGAVSLNACAGGDKKKESTAKKDAKPTPAQEFKALADDYWAFQLRESPEYATILGVHDHDDKLTDVTADGFDRRGAQLNGFLARATGLDPAALSEADRTSLDILLTLLRDQTRAYELGTHRWELLSQLDGPQSGGFTLVVTKYHPRATQKDIENLVARYKAFTPWMDAYLMLLKSGMDKQETVPSVVVDRVVAQLKELTTPPPEKSVFAAVTLPADLAEDVRKALTDELANAVKDSVIPAFQKLQTFLETDYILNARADPGISKMPNGEALYAHFIQHHTTRVLTADELHANGLAELERVEKEMMEIAVAQKFNKKGKLPEFTAKLMKDKKSFPKDKEALLAAYREALERARTKVPEVLQTLPSVDVEVAEMDPARAASAPAAYYEESDLQHTRKAQVVVNTFKVETRALFFTEAVAFHEGIPGHHVQWAGGQDLADIPQFRRQSGFGAFVEGWALYAERLADELNLYSTPLHRFGYLGARAWRATRLVVDTGLHAKGWDRAKALDFMKQHTVLGQADLENEVDRYILWPGQALAYLVGAQQIESLRQAARDQLGAGFDLKKFHAAVLGGGSLPLDVLKTRVEAFVAAEKKAAEDAKGKADADTKAAEAAKAGSSADGGTPAPAADGGTPAAADPAPANSDAKPATTDSKPAAKDGKPASKDGKGKGK